jgi:hypothetical protein
MSTRAQTKIFGIRIGVDPKILAGGLIAVAVALFWYNSRSDEDTPSPPSTSPIRNEAAGQASTVRPSALGRTRRSQSSLNDRDTLHLRPIDASRGDVDPTLRLDLLARLQNVQPASAGRSLFELGPPPLTPAEQALIKHPPPVPKPTPVPTPGPVVPADQPLNIPLKYYGYIKSAQASQGNEGLFLDGDDVVVGSEGEIVMKHYLIVALTPSSARLEDTQLKKGQTLPVVPAATP